MLKQSIHKIKGMQRDLSVSSFNPEYAYENKNVRIMPTDDSTLLSIINEKGNKELYINDVGDSIVGDIIGVSKLNDEAILFSSGTSLIGDIDSEESDISDIQFSDLELNIEDTSDDRIYKVWFNNKKLYGKVLFKGSLNFSVDSPIESISLYENESIKKIYWTDGINQLRLLNLSEDLSKWNTDSFNFVRRANFNETFEVRKISNGNGIFPSGVIQYLFTYYNKHGQESNIINVSPLYYISLYNSGEAADKSVNNSFEIRIENVDTTWDYLRIYSIIRTSIDATPEVKILSDIPTQSTITYIDNNTGSTIDPTQLLYIGGEELIAKTISYKDNTFFAGNIEIKRRALTDDIIDFFRGKEVTYDYSTSKKLDGTIATGYYTYNSQLGNSSNVIKYFKYLEYYRFGLQFQHYTGKWSDPVWMCDLKNTLHVKDEDTGISLPMARYTLSDKTIINKLLSLGYTRVRPVVVYPSLSDRECICQGVLNPTVYNVQDRYNNSPFSQASWFFRPNQAFDIDKSGEDYTPIVTDGSTISLYSKGGVLLNGKITVKDGSSDVILNPVNKGSWIEFRHDHALHASNTRGAEIQCMSNPQETPIIDIKSTEQDKLTWVTQHSDDYYVDQSILTLNSPDIEFNDDLSSIDPSNLRMRIIGYIPITGFVSDVDIQTSTSTLNFKDSSDKPRGFYKEKVSESNISYFGSRLSSSEIYWFDEIYGNKVSNPSRKSTGFLVYPWHRNGSLNNQKYNDDSGSRSSMLKYKKMSNLRYSNQTKYLDTIWAAYASGDPDKNGCSVKIFNSNEVVNIKLDTPTNSDIKNINYYGNVDKVLLPSMAGSKSDGYPIAISYSDDEETNSHDIFCGTVKYLGNTNTDTYLGIDPISIKYKSTPHAVIILNYTNDGEQVVLPTALDKSYSSDEWHVNPVYAIDESHTPYYSESNSVYKIYQDVVNNLYPRYGYLWLGELYNENVLNRFGGTTQEAIENNKWLPCGKAVKLSVTNDSTIEWTEGDTYYQRYDCLKTYPFTLEDQNSIVEILSFMCETRVNLDGRYDSNRGQTNNLVMTPTNFNLINKVYSQDNNFFSYRILDSDISKLNKFSNTITWSKTKTLGEKVDTWTNLNLESTLDFDGDKGEIRSIDRFNNELIVFQDSGISNILYNTRTQLSTSSGVPVELANSGKVDGKRYITENVGCQNKWSICTTANGIYFIDDITKGIYLFNGKLDNLSDRLGFHSWINKNSVTTESWNPYDFTNRVTYYDKVNGDVFFISKNDCLAFSEALGQFTSFYSYEDSPYFFNIEDNGVFIHKGSNNKYKLWYHNEGDYNMYFGKYQPFYTTIISNSDYGKDKIFNNVEFRADSWNSSGKLLNTTFDTLDVWNEYQSGKCSLVNTLNRPSNLKRKFRIWRANIPRDSSNNRDRMRNPWLYLKLSMNTENTNRTILQDIMVNYFI